MNKDKIKRLPYSAERTRRLNTKKRVLPCLVSARWLQFPEKLHCFTDGNYLSINLMTKTLNDDLSERESKLCELVFFKEDLEAMLKEFDKVENQT